MVEVLATVALLALAMGPALLALQSALQTADADLNATANDYRVLELMEQIAAAPFESAATAAAGVATPSSYSDPVGTPDRRIAYIAEYDIDNADADNDPFTGTESDMLWVRVEIAGTVHALETLKGRP